MKQKKVNTIYFYIFPCALCPWCVYVTGKGNLLCGIQRGKKSSFCALWIFVEIRTVCVFLLMAAFTFRMNWMFLKWFCTVSANIEGLWEAVWGFPCPPRRIMEIRKGLRSQVHFLLGVPSDLSVLMGSFCVVEAYILPSELSQGSCIEQGPSLWCGCGWLVLGTTEAKVKGLSPSWTSHFYFAASQRPWHLPCPLPQLVTWQVQSFSHRRSKVLEKWIGINLSLLLET